MLALEVHDAVACTSTGFKLAREDLDDRPLSRR
jgi:hypothetical protein